MAAAALHVQARGIKSTRKHEFKKVNDDCLGTICDNTLAVLMGTNLTTLQRTSLEMIVSSLKINCTENQLLDAVSGWGKAFPNENTTPLRLMILNQKHRSLRCHKLHGFDSVCTANSPEIYLKIGVYVGGSGLQRSSRTIKSTNSGFLRVHIANYGRGERCITRSSLPGSDIASRRVRMCAALLIRLLEPVLDSCCNRSLHTPALSSTLGSEMVMWKIPVDCHVCLWPLITSHTHVRLGGSCVDGGEVDRLEMYNIQAIPIEDDSCLLEGEELEEEPLPALHSSPAVDDDKSQVFL
ncbi:conserved hypothetical protein [Culex quinquefasciatus]|uniref:BACK domain-containing protein n=1 Tax=Culex quinquefasciatus TaxID=7176 RepID=B0X8T0_CULQU|nr:conserved hypothetical protein [Culex quinquefasciatus]|eukprot:XP_001866052.1 conserved hypothetical protein [Culex quinquefasciatus]